jgi:chromosome partitioning protein
MIPLQAEFLPLKGVHSFMRQFNSIQKRLNPGINLLGFVLTKFDDRKKMNHHVQEQLEAEFGNKVFQTHIRTCISLAKAQEAGLDIFSFDKNSNAANDYSLLGKEVLEKLKTK